MAYPFPPQPPRRGLTTGGIVAIVLGTLIALCCITSAGMGMVTMMTAPDPEPSATPTGRAVPPRAEPTPAERPPSPEPAPSPTVAAMPNVVGANAAVAYDQLAKLGFTNIQFGSAEPDDKVVLLASNWTVTKQSSPPGTQVATDALVVLTCRKT